MKKFSKIIYGVMNEKFGVNEEFLDTFEDLNLACDASDNEGVHHRIAKYELTNTGIPNLRVPKRDVKWDNKSKA